MTNKVVNFPNWAVAWLMPMHAIVSQTGHIEQVGPTLNKLRPGGFLGARFLEAFELRRPRSVMSMADLNSDGGLRLNLRLRDYPDIPMRGLTLPLEGGRGLFVNLTFGIAATEAARVFDLSSRDFSPTDLNIDMMYLAEAKSAVEAESRRLNLRLQGAKSEAEEQATTDILTGLKNRRGMDAILERYKTYGEKFSMVHLDLDFFKEVNDSLGHAAGDFVLKEAAKILSEELRSEDAMIRLGGDEFVLLIHRLTDKLRLRKVCSRILRRLEKAMIFEGNICKISGSMGITMSDNYDKIDIAQMLVDADFALYAAKRAGRAQCAFVCDVGGIGQSVAELNNVDVLKQAG